MINNEYELLKFLVNIMDENNTINGHIAEVQSELDAVTIVGYIKSLKSQGLISSDLANIYITSKGISHIQTESVKSEKEVSDKNRQNFYVFLKWILGIITAVIIAAIIFWLGLN